MSSSHKLNTELDQICIDDLCVFVSIGCGEDERAFPQKILFDLCCFLDTKKAARSGKLSDTLCYLQIEQTIGELAMSKKWGLLEELGDAICSLLLENFPLLAHVQLTIRKFVSPTSSQVRLNLTRFR